MIDPTISLNVGRGVPQFDPMAAAERGLKLGELMMRPEILQQQLSSARTAEQLTRQQIEASKTTQQLTATQIDELKLKVADDTLRQLTTKRLGAITNELAEKDEKGNILRVPFEQVGLRAAAEGLHPETVNSYLTKTYANAASKLTNDKDKFDYARQKYTEAANQARGRSDAEANSIIDAVTGALGQAVGQEVTSAARQSIYGTAQGPGMATVAQQVATSASISPQQAVANKQRDRELAVSEGRLQLETILEHATPQDRDSNSEKSRNYRKLLLDAGADPAIVGTVEKGPSAFDLASNKAIQAHFQKEQITSSDRKEGLDRKVVAETSNVPVQGALSLENRIRQVVGTKVGSAAQAAIAQYITLNPEVAVINSALNDMNQAKKTNVTFADGVDIVFAKLKKYQEELRTQSAAGGAQATSRTYKEASEKIPSAGGMQTGVNLTSPDGKRMFRNVPVDKARDYVSSGAAKPASPEDARLLTK